jgi:DNA repair protein RecO (recombination protein O)
LLLNTKAIVISAIRYQEKSLIVRCFTEAAGLKSYFVRNAFSGKGAQKIGYFQPLTLLEIEASHKNKGTLEHFREIRLSAPYQSIPADVSKTTLALFVSEILHHAIREEEANGGFFAFLETAMHWLDTHDSVANFHLILLIETSKFLGFYPETSSSHPFFEMTEGMFVPHLGVSCLSAEETHLLRRLMALRFKSDQKVFSSGERQQLLKILMDYYSLHLDGFQKPKSLDVLREVFN